MYKVAIIEDEEDAQEMLVELISKTNKFDIVGIAGDVKAAINLINNSKPDLIVTDIKIIGGTAFDVLNNIKTNSAINLFITAYDEFALHAIKEKAFDYIVKPVNPKVLIDSLNQCIIEIQKQKIFELFKNLKKDVVNISNVSLLLSNDISKVNRIQAESNYSRIYFIDKKPIIVSKTLKDLEQKTEQFGFLRVHQSHLINLRFIDKINLQNDIIYMLDGIKIPISRSRKKIFIKKRKLLGF